jgi:hypothetical protein
MALAMALSVISCDKKQSNAGTSQSKEPTQSAQADQNMSGKVSNNGKTFTNDSDSKSYTVGNPDALKDYQDQHVAVLFHVDPETGAIHITQIVTPLESMSAKVGKDAKTVVDDKDKKSYGVTNPDALKGHEGQHVALVVHVDPASGLVHIAQVETAQR